MEKLVLTKEQRQEILQSINETQHKTPSLRGENSELKLFKQYAEAVEEAKMNTIENYVEKIHKEFKDQQADDLSFIS